MTNTISANMTNTISANVTSTVSVNSDNTDNKMLDIRWIFIFCIRFY